MPRPFTANVSRRSQKTSRIKPLTVELSEAFRDAIHAINRIETLFKDILQRLEGDSGDDEYENESENDIETGISKRNNGGGNTDIDPDDTRISEGSYEDSSEYVCPDEACKRRKADKHWKQYLRHYEIHVPCTVRCSFCPTVTRNVAALKRHYVECVELKQKRHMGEYKEKLYEMKRQRDKESNKASAKAQEMLGTRKRRLSYANNLRPRKKAQPTLESSRLSSSTHEHMNT